MTADTPAVRPPPEHAGKKWHWIEFGMFENNKEPVKWHSDFEWWELFHNDGVCVDTEEAHALDWRYIGPCEPPA